MSRNPRPSEVAAKLDWAANFIDTHGWCRDTLVNDQGRVCAVGGITGATVQRPGGSYSRVASRATDAVEGLLNPQGLDGPTWIGLEQYNDEVAKDKRYVTRKLRRAAQLVRAGRLRWNPEQYEYVLNKGGNK